MSHNYLLDLNHYIEARKSELTTGPENAATTLEENRQAEGRLDVLERFQSFLCQDYYPRLPKRIYRQLTASACGAVTQET